MGHVTTKKIRMEYDETRALERILQMVAEENNLRTIYYSNFLKRIESE